MTVESFRAALSMFGDRVRATPDDRWLSPTPCPDWTAKHIVVHAVENLRGLLTALNGGDFLSARGSDVPDPVADAYTREQRAVESRLDDGIDLNGPVIIGANELTVEYLIKGLMRDLVIHSWDLARAVRTDDRLPSDLVTAATEAMSLVTAAMRHPGSYGTQLPAPEGADDQTRLLASAGRSADWPN